MGKIVGRWQDEYAKEYCFELVEKSWSKRRKYSPDPAIKEVSVDNLKLVPQTICLCMLYQSA